MGFPLRSEWLMLWAHVCQMTGRGLAWNFAFENQPLGNAPLDAQSWYNLGTSARRADRWWMMKHEVIRDFFRGSSQRKMRLRVEDQSHLGGGRTASGSLGGPSASGNLGNREMLLVARTIAYLFSYFLPHNEPKIRYIIRHSFIYIYVYMCVCICVDDTNTELYISPFITPLFQCLSPLRDFPWLPLRHKPREERLIDASVMRKPKRIQGA